MKSGRNELAALLLLAAFTLVAVGCDASGGGAGGGDIVAEDAGPSLEDRFCPLVGDSPRCDDGDPCTRDYCDVEAGGCVNAPATGAACVGAEGCGEGRCYEGSCVDFALCDDGFLCSEDRCEAGGACTSVPADTVGRRAPTFALRDTNPYSPTEGEVFDSQALAGRAVALLFHPSSCEPCAVQAEAARALYAEIEGMDDVVFATVDTRGAMKDVEGYVTYDGDGEPPLVSRWPVLQDDDESKLWFHACAETDQLAIFNWQGEVIYHRIVNFEDAPFFAEIRSAIDSARRPAGE